MNVLFPPPLSHVVVEQLGELSAFTHLLRTASIKNNRAKQTKKKTNVSFKILRIILWDGSQATGFSCVKPVVYKVWRGFNRQIHVLLLLFAEDGESGEATAGEEHRLQLGAPQDWARKHLPLRQLPSRLHGFPSVSSFSP